MRASTMVIIHVLKYFYFDDFVKKKKKKFVWSFVAGHGM